MIQMADVGIGISGQEGRQAVMASDFAMGQFRFLVPLLLVHGHWNYQRISYLILYNIYKSSILVFIDYWAFNNLLSTGAFWLTVLSMVAIALLPRFTCKVFKDYLFPNDVRIGREMEKLEKDVAVAEDEMDSPTNSHR